MILNRAELGDMFGVSLSSVDKFVREGMPYLSRPSKGGEGWRFASKDCIGWFVNRGKAGTNKGKREEIDLRTAEADAIIREYKAAELQKNMVHKNDVVTLFEEQNLVVKSRLIAIPGRVAQAVAVEEDPAAVLRILKAEVNEALEDISNADAPVLFEEPKAEEPGPEDNFGY